MTRAGSREPGKKAKTKLHDVRVAESTHKLTLPHKLGCGSANLCRGDLRAVHEDVVDLFSSADGSRHCHFLHATVGSRSDSDASQPNVG